MFIKSIIVGLSFFVFALSVNAEVVSVDQQIAQLELLDSNIPQIKKDLTLQKIAEAIQSQTKVVVYFDDNYEDNLRVLRILRRYRMNAELAGVNLIHIFVSHYENKCEIVSSGLFCRIKKGASEQEILNLLAESYGVLAETTDEEWMSILKSVTQDIEKTNERKQQIRELE